jgi:hypothetical protein
MARQSRTQSWQSLKKIFKKILSTGNMRKESQENTIDVFWKYYRVTYVPLDLKANLLQLMGKLPKATKNYSKKANYVYVNSVKKARHIEILLLKQNQPARVMVSGLKKGERGSYFCCAEPHHFYAAPSQFFENKHKLTLGWDYFDL